jgi:hypothetical protein
MHGLRCEAGFVEPQLIVSLFLLVGKRTVNSGHSGRQSHGSVFCFLGVYVVVHRCVDVYNM